MEHRYLENLPLEEAKSRFLAHLRKAGFAPKTERVAVQNACGRVLAKAVYAHICAPHYNASAMDGVAVRAAVTFGASERTPLTLRPEDYTVVDTGDPLPEGSDAVIMVEDLIDAPNGCYEILSAVRPWQNVRQVGEDICMGDMIAPGGTKLTPALCGALLAGGVTEVEVIRPPLVAILPTGDEIVAPTSDPKPGDIIEFNSTVFRGMLERWGAKAEVFPIVPDKKDQIRAAMEKALSRCDIVLVSAGSSAGRDDYTSEIIASLGKVLVHGIAIKPGKPAVLGEAQGKPVVGLPGYPVSAIVVMDEIVRDLVYECGDLPAPKPETLQAVLSKRIVSSLKYREYVRVTLGKIGGVWSASPLPRGAGVISSFTKADGLLVIGQNCEGIEAGETVDVRLLRPVSELENTLIVTGSHDPLIDEVTDLLMQQGAPFRVCSTHVGSMGAIHAMRAGLAHMGGIHLLDTQTGEYNKRASAVCRASWSKKATPAAFTPLPTLRAYAMSTDSAAPAHAFCATICWRRTVCSRNRSTATTTRSSPTQPLPPSSPPATQTPGSAFIPRRRSMTLILFPSARKPMNSLWMNDIKTTRWCRRFSVCCVPTRAKNACRTWVAI